MKNYRWLALGLSLSLILSACGPTEPPRPGIDVPPPQVRSAAPVSQETPTLPTDVPAPIIIINPNPTEAPPENSEATPITDQASENYLMVTLDYPDEVPLYESTEVSFLIAPSPGLCNTPGAIDEVEVSLSVSMTTLDIIDADLSLPGLQLIIERETYPNPETLQVLENGTDDLWVMHYHVKGLGYPTEYSCFDFILMFQELFRLSLRAVEEGLGEITIRSFVARTAEGQEIPVNYSPLPPRSRQSRSSRPHPPGLPVPNCRSLSRLPCKKACTIASCRGKICSASACALG